MKKNKHSNKYLFVAILLLAVALAGACVARAGMALEGRADEEGVLVVTSFYPIYVATLNVAGDCPGVVVENLSEPQTGCLHDYELTPQDMILLSEADIFVVNGGGMEGFLTEVASEFPDLVVIDSGAGGLASDDAAAMDASANQLQFAVRGDAMMTSDDAAADEGAGAAASGFAMDASAEEEEETNAHVWMSIPRYMEQVRAIARGLSEADAAHKDGYEAGAEAYLGQIRELQDETQELAEQTQGMGTILFHEAFAYLAEDYGMPVAYSLDLDEERQVSAGEVADVMAAIRQGQVRILLAEELYGKRLGDTVEAETDCRVCYLDTLTRGSYERGSWLDGMRNNIALLREAVADAKEG